MADCIDHVRERFIEQMGLVAQADNLPRIAGRILALLIFEGRPVRFGELAERLEVSRGSVSSNTRLLEEIGVVERVTKPGERQDYFQLAPDPYVRLLEGTVKRMRKAHTVPASAAEALPKGHEALRARLDALATFYAAVAESCETLARDFPERQGGPGAGNG